MRFNYHGQEARLSWFTQELVTTSLDTVYGRELLCRGFITETDAQIPMETLIPYLYLHSKILLTMTCQQIRDSCDYQPAGGKRISTWINIGGPLIAEQHLFRQLWRDSLRSLSPLQKQALVLEICESDIGDEQVVERVAFLKKNGFMIAMDDFGAGHSNLLRLNQAEFDIIKLDLNLLSQVPSDLWAASFYREIVNLCASKGCLIVAEGVETPTQSDFVRWAGVDLIQGYLYSSPELWVR